MKLLISKILNVFFFTSRILKSVAFAGYFVLNCHNPSPSKSSHSQSLKSPIENFKILFRIVTKSSPTLDLCLNCMAWIITNEPGEMKVFYQLIQMMSLHNVPLYQTSSLGDQIHLSREIASAINKK